MKFEVFRWISIKELIANGYTSEIAQVPTLIQSEDKFFVYVAGRDKNNQSHINLIVLDNTFAIEEIRNNVFEKSMEVGTFDDEGVMPAQIFPYDDGYVMTFSGWNTRNTIPYHNATGLAFSRNLIDWKRLYKGPILDRIPLEPYLAVTPWIIGSAGAYEMLYISGIDYKLHDNKYEPIYTVKYANSKDLIHWDRSGEAVIQSYKNNLNACFSHPSFIKLEESNYLFATCIRDYKDYRDGSNGYSLVTTTTNKLFMIHDVEKVQINVSNECFVDPAEFSKMQAYPSLFEFNSSIYCLFNGNGFGRTGFGIARVNID